MGVPEEERTLRPDRWRQIGMAGLLGLFLLGLFWAPVGRWTGPARVV